MKILITGAAGFVGKNLSAELRSYQMCGEHASDAAFVDHLYLYDLDTPEAELWQACRDADFVFHLAGVNRADNPEDFVRGNCDLTSRLLAMLEQCGNRCPVMFASSIQASLCGRYDGPYGRSKRECERLIFDYARRNHTHVYVYRFPNLFGKWCRPDYNSVTATFCHHIANGLPITVDDPDTSLELLYIDDLAAAMTDLLRGRVQRCDYRGTEALPCADGAYGYVPTTYRVTLGEMVRLLEAFRRKDETPLIPSLPDGSFAKKLYAAYISYLPSDRIVFPLQMHTDARGSFTELLRTSSNGQISVNVAKPGVIRGEHWHHSKWEVFVVVSGRGRIQQRKVGTDEILHFDVSGDRMEAVHLLPGYVHNIVNLSDTEDLVTLMWASVCYDPANPDTICEEVERNGSEL